GWRRRWRTSLFPHPFAGVARPQSRPEVVYKVKGVYHATSASIGGAGCLATIFGGLSTSDGGEKPPVLRLSHVELAYGVLTARPSRVAVSSPLPTACLWRRGVASDERSPISLRILNR